ncbi:hypothetical protein NC652_031811 [Populus alba x Populus x berolinensis]|nr:hypothetical protein NC652_031811 [Populus alba x Populus x berolinensis]
MEEHKKQYTRYFLARSAPNEDQALDDCGKLVRSLDSKVRAYYARPIDFSEDQLAKMLLFDGCFILELLLRYSKSEERKEYDPIFDIPWMLSVLQRDLALLENQIPLLVLEILFTYIARHTAKSLPPLTLLDLALYFFRPFLNNKEEIHVYSGREISHFLDLIHRSYLPSSPESDEGSLILISCATELRGAGIEFQKGTSKHLLDLKFENGVFEIPELAVFDSTESLLRNLIAFEQCLQLENQFVTSYAVLMDRLVNTTRDVKLLERKKIIQNNLGAYEDISNLLNRICKEVVVREFYFAKLSKKVNAYYEQTCHQHRAPLKRNYFKNPWTIISVIAASVLLSLTILQTIYSVLSYYHS